MGYNDSAAGTVTLRVSRFTPRPVRERERSRPASPFARGSSPFGPSTPSASRKARGTSWVEEYTLNANGQDSILDCLLTVKRTIDPTLAFRYSCGHGMCGSDAVAINGTPTLLCTATVARWARKRTATGSGDGFRRTGNRATDTGISADRTAASRTVDGMIGGLHQDAQDVRSVQDVPDGARGGDDGTVDWGVIELAPLPGFPVQRDLIADIDGMMEQIAALKPYLQADDATHDSNGSNGGTAANGSSSENDGEANVGERLQSAEQLAAYDKLSDCIACGVCEASCPVFAGGDAFIGPAALITAARFINDSRDAASDARLESIDTADGIAACQSVRACSRECPKGIDVGEEIWQLIARVHSRR